MPDAEARQERERILPSKFAGKTMCSRESHPSCIAANSASHRATVHAAAFCFSVPLASAKTELTIAFTRYLTGDEKLFRFDLSEDQTQDSLGLLLGGKLGEVGLLGLAVAKSSTGTLLFDEIEKAHPRSIHASAPVRSATRSRGICAGRSRTRCSRN